MKIFKWNLHWHDWEFKRYIAGEERRRTGKFLEYRCKKCGKIIQTCCKLYSPSKIVTFEGKTVTYDGKPVKITRHY